MDSLLEVSKVKKYFGSKEALKGVSFTIRPGEVFGLLGVNGAGKTTLSSLIASLSPVSSGDILYRGKSIYDDIVSYRCSIGYCPQMSNLNPKLSLEDNLKFAGRYYGMSKKTLEERFEELVDKFDLQEYIKLSSKVLSGGYRQRFLIARSLMHSPSLVLLDEPTVALDPHVRYQLWETIKGLKNDGVSVVLTTHYLDEAEELSDRVCILDKGSVVLIEKPDALKKQYNKTRLEDVFLELMNQRSGL